MQLVAKFDAVDERDQVHTASVYRPASGSPAYRLDDREHVAPWSKDGSLLAGLTRASRSGVNA